MALSQMVLSQLTELENTMKTTHYYTVIAAACFTLAAPMFATAAIKTSQVADTKIVVSYTQSEIQQPNGLARIEKEIRRAADKVCYSREYSKTRSLHALVESKACVDDAVSDAMQTIDKLQASN